MSKNAFQLHHHISKLDPEYAHKVSTNAYPIISKYFRHECHGLTNLPEHGPFLGVGNHGGAYMIPDSILWIGKYYTLKRHTHMLSLVHKLAQKMYDLFFPSIEKFGLIEANFEIAEKALESGYAVMVYPGGDLEANQSFKHRHNINFFGHVGYIKLAIETQVPIVPVVSIGGNESLFVLWDGRELAKFLHLDEIYKLKVFPLIWSFPFGLSLGIPKPAVPLPSKIITKILPPFDTSVYQPKDSQDEKIVSHVDQEIRKRMQQEMDSLAKDRSIIFG